jgi:protein involved in polysaccharide export with SLBB domain
MKIGIFWDQTKRMIRSQMRYDPLQGGRAALSWAVDESYRLNPGDKLEITVWQEENLHAEVVVLPDGTISFPLVGPVPAAKKATGELVTLLKERLSKFMSEPEINIWVLAADGKTIYVIGEVLAVRRLG